MLKGQDPLHSKKSFDLQTNNHEKSKILSSQEAIKGKTRHLNKIISSIVHFLGQNFAFDFDDFINNTSKTNERNTNRIKF